MDYVPQKMQHRNKLPDAENAMLRTLQKTKMEQKL